MSKVDFTKVNTVRICFNCGSNKSYTNPFETCYECKKRFCFGCIWGVQINSKMSKDDPIRSVCDGCKEKHGYKTL